MSDKPKFIFDGDLSRGEALGPRALLELSLLKEDMGFQDLKTGTRRFETEEGDIIVCRSAHGQNSIHVFAAAPDEVAEEEEDEEEEDEGYEYPPDYDDHNPYEDPGTDEKFDDPYDDDEILDEIDPNLIRFSFSCSDGKQVNNRRLSYLVLYDRKGRVAYLYDAATRNKAIHVKGNTFTIKREEISAPEDTNEFWAFYACHEDVSVYGSLRLSRCGVRTQYPRRCSPDVWNRDDDFVSFGYHYRCGIPYGCFKLGISKRDEDGHSQEVTRDLTFHLFRPDGLNACDPIGDPAVYSHSSFSFWVFVLHKYLDIDETLVIEHVDDVSRCECDIEKEEEEEEREFEVDREIGFAHIDEIKGDKRLQLGSGGSNRCSEETQGFIEDLLRTKSRRFRRGQLCAMPDPDESLFSDDFWRAFSPSNMKKSHYWEDCTHWLCLSLIREYDMAIVTPDMLTHLAITTIGRGEMVSEETLEDIESIKSVAHFRLTESSEEGVEFGYGYEPYRGRDLWTVAIPGVAMDWNGSPTDLFLLAPQQEGEKHFEDDDDDDEDHEQWVWLEYSPVGPIRYNERTAHYEAFLGPHPARAYNMSYNCDRGLLTRYLRDCCFSGPPTGGAVSAQIDREGSNYFLDIIFPDTFRFEITCCGEEVYPDAEDKKSRLAKAYVYKEDGTRLDGVNLNYNKETKFWEFRVGGKQACPVRECEEYGVYVVVKSGGKDNIDESPRCQKTLFPGECEWDVLSDGELLPVPGDYEIELCPACPDCSALDEIDGHSLSTYEDHVQVQNGDTVDIFFATPCGTEGLDCEDFVNSLTDGLSEERKGTFSGGSGSEAGFSVTYNASSNLCNDYDAGRCPKICGQYTLPCCCACYEDISPVLHKVDCNSETRAGKYRIEAGCPPFNVQRRDRDEDGNWTGWDSYWDKTWGDCDWGGEQTSECWFCHECDHEAVTDGCPEDGEFEIRVTDSLGRESNAVSSKITVDNALYEPPESDPDNPETVDNVDSVTVCVVKGWGPFTWELIAGEDVTMNEDVTGRCNTFEAGPDACGSAIARVTDDCGTSTTVSVRILNGQWTFMGNYCGLSNRSRANFIYMDVGYTSCEPAQFVNYHPGRFSSTGATFTKGHQKQEENIHNCHGKVRRSLETGDPRCDAVAGCREDAIDGGVARSANFHYTSFSTISSCITPGHIGCQGENSPSGCNYWSYAAVTSSLSYYEWTCPES